jgi:23S rRNA pseudouridine1911/1915/1917 synthase
MTKTIPPAVLDASVTSATAKLRLDKALTTILTHQVSALSRARVQALIEAGLVSHQGKPIFDASRKVKNGELYVVHLPPPEPAKPEAQNIDLQVIYEDRDLLVIDKPAGLVVHPAPGNRTGTLVNALLAHCGRSLSGIGGVTRPGIVHRLDKNTSGLMVVAKNDLAHQALTSQFSDRSLSRIYHALVWGEIVPRTGTIDAPIGRHTRDRKKMAVTTKGRTAVTHYKVLKNLGTVSLVECKLTTGRTHQIRVHLAHIKHPVVGDPVYGKGRSQVLFPRQALHAVQLTFKHPRTNKTMRFTSSLPEDMAKLLESF